VDMLATLRSRCGLNATIGSTPALSDILTEAHEYCYQQMDDGYPVTSTIALLANTATYSWISSDSVPIARGSVQEVWIEQGSADRVHLPQGITHAMRADTTSRSIPEAYDTNYAGTDDGTLTLEVWPTPDQAYTLYVDHERVLTRFSADADLPSVDYRLVLGYAVAMGKAHYGKADAETAGAAFKTMLYKAKVKQKENRRFLPPACGELQPYVITTATNFRQVWR
jgi:hypothetical protein